MVEVIINGQQMEFDETKTVLELIKHLDIEQKVMAAAINMEVVKKENWPIQKINNGDKVEFLQFVGGG